MATCLFCRIIAGEIPATWVYEDLGGNAYTRRRIEVSRHAGDRAVVGRGLREGVKVVTAGAAELFGTEFGAGH